MGRILKSYILLAVGLVFLIALTTFFSFRAYYLGALQKQLITDTKLIGDIVTLFIQKGDRSGLWKELKKISKSEQLRLTLIDQKGKVVFDTAKDPATMENHAARAEVFAALQGELGFAHHFSATLRQDMMYAAVPLRSEQLNEGVLRTSIFVADIHQLMAPLYRQIFIWSLVFLAAAIFLAAFLAHKFYLPLQEIPEAAVRIAAGDFSANIIAGDSYESQKLADGFNYMSKKLQGLINDLKQQKEELSIIIESIQEGLLVIDGKGIIGLTNGSFKKIFKLSDPHGKYYWDVLREPELGERIKNVQTSNKPQSGELLIGERIYLVSSAFLAGGKGLALFFKDVTELKQLEKVKKDFVVNASHELRTPLTAIKGFVETLEEELSGEQKYYLEIIKKHTERLINIVQDIMLLAELEERSSVLKLEKTDIKKMLKDIFNIFEEKFKAKKLSFVINGEDILLTVDPFRMQQVFINLLDNAYKYTEQGGVNVNIVKEKDTVVIMVQDTGIGIPKSDLGRIFERFYVVDKSRTRTVGGTGLGLSIVKHIILLHGGTIEVESSPLLGTKFIIKLPG